MNEKNIIETVLLLALPASGKSEVRTYMSTLSDEVCLKDFHMGPTVQLDDYPYVHFMRCVDEELIGRGKPSIYFITPDKPFKDPRQWGTLVELLNEDHVNLYAHNKTHPKSAAEWLFARLDAAAGKAGATGPGSSLDAATRTALADTLEKEARHILDERNAASDEKLEGRTLVIEFARGGAQGSPMPLPEPFGYGYSVSMLSPAILKNASILYSLGQLHEDILRKAGILYIWVTPEESRRKNFERARPDGQGSILHHGVPIDVMMNDYGCDDMDWLEKTSEKPGTVTITAASGGGKFHLPLGRFDNRVDKTSFIRKDRRDWTDGEIAGIHGGLKQGFDAIIAKCR